MKKIKIFESKINEGIKDSIKNIIANKGYGEVLASINKSIDDLKRSGYTFLEISDTLNQFYNIGDSTINDYIKSKGYNIKDIVNESSDNDFTAQDVAFIITDTNSKGIEITPEQLTPEMIKNFNKGFNDIMKKFPDYNPYTDKSDGEDYSMNITLSDSIIEAIKGNSINEGAEDKSKEIKDVLASTTPDREEKLKELNQYFINLQNRYELTPTEENQWKQVSKALFGNS